MIHDKSTAAGAAAAPGQGTGRASFDGKAITIQLAEPIPVGESDVSQVVVKMPTFGDFIDLGPIEHFRGADLDQLGRPQALESHLDRDALLKWMQRLTGLQRHSLALLSPGDANRLTLAVKGVVGMFTSAGNLPSGSTS